EVVARFGTPLQRAALDLVLDPDASATRALDLAERLEAVGHAAAARTALAAIELARGHRTEAIALADAAWASFLRDEPLYPYGGEILLVRLRAHGPSPALADEARRWLEAAQIAPEMRADFISKNEFNHSIINEFLDVAPG